MLYFFGDRHGPQKDHHSTQEASIQDEMDYESRTHHTALDGAGFLVEDDLKQASMVLASMVYHVANREGLMPRTALPAPRKP